MQSIYFRTAAPVLWKKYYMVSLTFLRWLYQKEAGRATGS